MTLQLSTFAWSNQIPILYRCCDLLRHHSFIRPIRLLYRWFIQPWFLTIIHWFASMWYHRKGSFCTGNQRAFHTEFSPSIKASSFVINAQDAIKYYIPALLLPLDISLIDNNAIYRLTTSTHFYFLLAREREIPSNVFLTGIYVVQGLLGLAIIHGGALEHLRPPFIFCLVFSFLHVASEPTEGATTKGNNF